METEQQNGQRTVDMIPNCNQVFGKGDDKGDFHQLGGLKGPDQGHGQPGGIIRSANV